LSSVFCFKVGVESENLGGAVPFGEHPNNCADRDARSSDAWLAAHHLRVNRNSIDSLLVLQLILTLSAKRDRLKEMIRLPGFQFRKDWLLS